ncbi:MAG: rhomboid family intramembrane serine protease [Bacteroidaceae bacterium]|nr:rhomboid family intramembrane serine protease [Bacteroidaceae bacterium]
MNRITTVVKNLLAINVLMFLATIVAEEKFGVRLSDYLGLHIFMADDFHPYQLVTYMFMHGGFTHLFVNMFSLYMFGCVLENVWGAKRFLIFYFVTGIGAAFVQELVQYIYYGMYLAQYDFVNIGVAVVPMNEYLNLWQTVGASGAVYGILLAFAMMFPNEKMFIIPIPFPIKAMYFVMIFIVLELLLGVSNNASDNVAHFAHLGGMLFGFLLIILWRKNGKIGGPYV